MKQLGLIAVGVSLAISTIYSGPLATGSLNGRGVTLNNDLRITGYVVEKLSDGVVICCAAPGATSTRTVNHQVYQNVFVKGPMRSFVNTPVRENGTYSYIDKNGTARTVRSYVVVE